jgi:hypothetical protein
MVAARLVADTIAFAASVIFRRSPDLKYLITVKGAQAQEGYKSRMSVTDCRSDRTQARTRPRRSTRATGLPLANQAHALVKVGGQVLRFGLVQWRPRQRFAGNEAAQQFRCGSTLLRLGRDDDGCESHGGLLSWLKCKKPPVTVM